MNWEYLIIYLIPSLLAVVNLSLLKIQGTDHHYHELIIKAIKKNKNRFILKNPYIIGPNKMAYPQLLHWILSFFNIKSITKFALWINICSTFASSILLFWFVHVFLNQTEFAFLYENKAQFIILTGLAYISFPFNYDMVNAKNSGISARGLGLFLGQLYLYLSAMFILTHSYIYLLVGVPIIILIFLTSAFTIQLVMFITFLLAILDLNLYLLAPLSVALLICFIVAPSFFKMFFRGQFSHKKLYSNYLAKIYILKTRYSIWRDLIYDIWVKLFNKKLSLADKIKYISTNSIVVLFTSFPFIVFGLIYFLFHTDIPNFIKVTSFSCFVLFLLTSFRITRFLGEPERYLEFGLGFYAIIVTISSHKYPFVFWGLLVYSIIFVNIRLRVYLNYIKKSSNVEGRKDVIKVKLFLEKEITLKETKQLVLSNSTQFSKILLSDNWQVFWHPLFQEKILKYHFKDLYNESYDYISEDILKDIIIYSKINYFLCNYNFIKSKKEFLNYFNTNKISLIPIKKYGNYLTLFKICLKP